VANFTPQNLKKMDKNILATAAFLGMTGILLGAFEHTD
jgi:hypothetical protein